jgi:hypothetical protein
MRTSRKDSVLTPSLDPMDKRHRKYGTLARFADDAIMSFDNIVVAKRLNATARSTGSGWRSRRIRCATSFLKQFTSSGRPEPNRT